MELSDIPVTKETITMSKLIGSKSTFIVVCLLFITGTCASLAASGSIPTFGSSLLPDRPSITISQSPLPPPPRPNPKVAQSPLPPPPRPITKVA